MQIKGKVGCRTKTQATSLTHSEGKIALKSLSTEQYLHFNKKKNKKQKTKQNTSLFVLLETSLRSQVTRTGTHVSNVHVVTGTYVLRAQDLRTTKQFILAKVQFSFIH
jgi:hypothetical protein